MLEYALLTFGSLFAIVDPMAVIPSFLAMTSRDTVEQRQRMAFVACLTSGGVMTAFAAFGPFIFKVLGITIQAFQIAGGLIMLLSALDMLRAKRTPLKETPEETEEGRGKDDVAITPLAIPMLSGPGAITTSIVLAERATSLTHRVVFYGCIAAVALAAYVILYLAATGARRVSPIAMNVMSRLMGLMLAAVGIQFILTALSLPRL
ncbi:MAG: NAAT family transporter [Elusimicrobia bacterium]|nr:NAAT family transporter [Elusimicrobiota bacterium]